MFDIQRAGALGIYAEGGPWGRQGSEKMVLLPMVEGVWVEEIARLHRLSL